MPICNNLHRLVLLLGLVFAASALHAQKLTETPYGPISIPFPVHQVPNAPVYYVEGLSGVPDASNEGHTSNAGFVVTDDGVVVFDALGTPALGYMLLKAIRNVTDKPVKYIVMSHYHADHIYGLQAFKEHANNPTVVAQSSTLEYAGGTRATQGEAAQRRLAQRREALFPWVSDKTYIVAPDQTFDKQTTLKLGGVTFEIIHVGPAHAPGDSIMLVKDYGVLFSGDAIYKGRIPFLDSPETDTAHWLDVLNYLTSLKPAPHFIIPGHGKASTNITEAIRFTHDYIQYVRTSMKQAVDDFVEFKEAYDRTDWSKYQDMPAFDASNRGNAYRIYLELEASSVQ